MLSSYSLGTSALRSVEIYFSLTVLGALSARGLTECLPEVRTDSRLIEIARPSVGAVLPPQPREQHGFNPLFQVAGFWLRQLDRSLPLSGGTR